MIYTSCFARSGKLHQAVAIARGVPRWFRGRIYDQLRPTREMLALDTDAYKVAYEELLAGLDPHEIATAIGDGSVMLCWERDPANCHRTMAARYLLAAGYDVEELTPNIHDRQLALFP